MKILIAEDEQISRHVLEATLIRWGYEVVVCADGLEAWQALQGKDAPQLAILDWMMPGMEGVEVCRKVREASDPRLLYLILLTGKDRREDLVVGLEAGADDYVAKPFDREELRARMRVGVRVLELQRKLADHARENARLDVLNQANAALAHHVRNAVTPILGWATMFDPGGSQEGAGLKKAALKEGRRIVAVIDALAEMSEAGFVPTVAYGGSQILDGGSQMLDLEPLIQRCLNRQTVSV